jgi:biopolymer transport protein ExbD
MKFPRNTRLLRSPFEVAPFAAVFFLLAMFMMLAVLLPTAGLRLQVPIGDNLPGTLNPSVAVAVDAGGRYFFANQLVANESALKDSLSDVAKKSFTPLTLIVHADKAVTYDQIVRLTLLARDSGITNVILATLPRTAAPEKQ